MAAVDRGLLFWLTLLAIGIAGMIISFLGEFVFFWWNDFGEWSWGGSLALTVIAAVATASRFQVQRLAGDLRDVAIHARQIPAIEGNTQRIEGNTQRIEANTQRIEDHTRRTEVNTERIQAHAERTEANTERIQAHAERTEANTEAIQGHAARTEATTERIQAHAERTEANTAATVQLLREIRDRLPQG